MDSCVYWSGWHHYFGLCVLYVGLGDTSVVSRQVVVGCLSFLRFSTAFESADISVKSIPRGRTWAS